MKPKAFLAALLASVLFVLLVAACFHRGEDPAQNCLERFGGPYPDNGTFQGDQLKVVMEEKAEGFAEYQRRGLDFSEAVELKDIDQLEESVKHNLTSPYGLTGQLYNYVIRPDCKIFVAVWTEKAANRGNADFREALTGEYVTEEGSNIDTCPGGRDFLPATREDTMINFYPEDLAKKFRNATETPQSPCWLGNLIGDNKAAAVQRERSAGCVEQALHARTA